MTSTWLIYDEEEDDEEEAKMEKEDPRVIALCSEEC